MKSLITIYRKYWKLVKPRPVQITILFVSKAFALFMEFLSPVAAANIIKYITLGDFTSSLKWASYFGVVYLGLALFYYWNHIAIGDDEAYSYRTLKRRAFHHLASYDLEFSKKIPIEQVQQTVSTDISDISVLNDHLSDLILTIGKIIAVSIFVIQINLVIGLLIALIYAVYLYLLDYFNKKKVQMYDGELRAEDQIGESLLEILSAKEEIRVYDMKEKIFREFRGKIQKFRHFYSKKRNYVDLQETMLSFLVFIGKAILYILMVTLLFQGKFAIDMIILIIGYYDQLLKDMDYIAITCLSEIRESGVNIERLDQFFKYRSIDMPSFGNQTEDQIEGHLKFTKVEASYLGNPALKRITFEAKPQEITAIVGQSGSGKTTILNNLLRLYKIDNGSITIDGKDIYEFEEGAYQKNVSVVTQKSFIFSMTIRENLSLVEKNREKQEAICKSLGIHEEILQLKKGYDTLLENNGIFYSTELKQMISIARALLTNAEILLFDEVTSSLDKENTKKCIRIFKELKKTHTVILITHKPQVMEIADHIIVMSQGRIVGDGKGAELIGNPYYERLIHKEEKK